MTAIFVHGVPETAAVWDPLVALLDRDDVECLGLPGFGSPMPDFAPTMQHYAAWLADQLAGYDEVDLVAHDWGALLALKVLAPKPANIRTWAMDGGDLSSDFQWHDLAKTWISPEGEAFMEGFVGATPADRGALLAASGVPEAGAFTMGFHIDQTMATCILALYRSAHDVGNEWGPGIDLITGPGLVLDAANDPFRSADRPRRLADRVGAEVESMPGVGHWWMLDDPQTAAEILQDFWEDPTPS